MGRDLARWSRKKKIAGSGRSAGPAVGKGRKIPLVLVSILVWI